MAKPHRGYREDACRMALLFVALTSLGVQGAQGVQEPRAADTCVPPPASFPIVNVTLPDSRIRRGVSVSIGTPPKQYSFLPNWGVNNTYLFGPKCNYESFIHTDAQCDVFRGGLYVLADSSSASVPSKSYVPAADPFPSSTYKLYTEKLTSDASPSPAFTIPDVVLGRPLDVTKWNLQGYNPQNMLGLALGSTIMTTLADAGRIVSRSAGFFWGLDGLNDRDQFPGSLVLGGYDRAKTIGNGYSQALTPTAGCPSGMMVLISDLVLNLRSGKDVSIFPGANGGTALQACLVPELPVLIELPLDPYWSNMEMAIGNSEANRSLGIDWWNVILNSSFPIYDGDLTFKLSSGLQITIPNHQLVVPERTIDEDGHIVANASAPVIRIDALQSSTALSLPRIGRYFFTAAYLMSNPDAGKFTLWQANPVNDVDLVAVDATNAIVPTDSSCQPKIPTSSNSNPNSHPNSTSTSIPSHSPSGAGSTGLSHGAIGGIAVGAAIAVVLAGLLAWWFVWRRRKAVSRPDGKRGGEAEDDVGSAMAMAAGDSAGTAGFGAQELNVHEQAKHTGGYSLYAGRMYTPPHAPPQELHDGMENLRTPGSVEVSELGVRGYTDTPASVELAA